MSEHTPLPWRLDGDDCVATTIELGGDIVAMWPEGYPYSLEYWPANAAFIVEACNSYHDLLHDISRQIEIAASLATENAELAARVKELEGENESLRVYALDATRALTGLHGGGSECFAGMIGGMYKADIPVCVERIKDRERRLHDLIAKRSALAKKEG